jgi:hypothetical protein
MRKFTLLVGLIVLMTISTVVVQAGFSWNTDPPKSLGNGYWAHLVTGGDNGITATQIRLDGDLVSGGVEAEGCATFLGRGGAGVRVWITEGKDGAILAEKQKRGQAPGRLCVRVRTRR